MLKSKMTTALALMAIMGFTDEGHAQEALALARCGNAAPFLRSHQNSGQTMCATIIPNPSCPVECNDPDDYTPTSSIVTIDVLHLYTPELAGDISNIVGDFVFQANDYLSQSSTLAQLRNIGIEPLPFILDPDEKAEEILGMLTSSSSVRSLRNNLSADIVVLIMPLVNDNYGPVCGKVRKVMMHDSLGPHFVDNAFQITVTRTEGCDKTYAHEMGHLLGLRHDQCAESNPPECGAFCFSFGYTDPNPIAFRTIMSTRLTCEVAGATLCDRIDYFSNRFAEYEGRDMWQDGVSDAARVINITAPIVANFRPENDNFTKRHVLSDFAGTTTGNNDGATHESGEPFHGGTPSRSVWWEWTAPESGDAFFTSENISFASVLAIYTGPTLDTLDPVVDTDSALDVVAFEAIGNMTYFIAVDSESEGTGDVELMWDLTGGQADLAVALAADRAVVGVGENVFYTAKVSNNGPYWATNVALEDVMDPSLGFVFAYIPGSPFSDDCTEVGGTVTCVVETFPDIGETLDVVIEAEVLAAGMISNTVSVSAVESDPVASNNTATVEILGVDPSSADLEVNLAVLRDPVNVGEQVTWLVNVQNKGPADASGVALTDVLPASVSFVGTNMPGICADVGGTVTCQIGVLESGAQYPTIEIVATANEGGTVINAVDLSGGEVDPTPLNNTAQTSVDIRNPSGAFETKLVASDGEEDDQLGYSIAVSGSTLVVGANLADSELLQNTGSAYVFVRDGNSWVQQQRLRASDAEPHDQFGFSVGIEGGTIVVGSVADDDAGGSSGSVYVFARNGASWTQQQKLTASDAEANDQFGYSVGISANTLLIGANIGDSKMAEDSGVAYIFKNDGAHWAQQHKLAANDAETNSAFGSSVSIAGDHLIVGDYLNNSAGSNSGAAYLFTRNDTEWVQVQKLLANDGEAGDSFGYSLAISGETAMIGTPHHLNTSGGSGAAYAFVHDETKWTQQQEITASDAPKLDKFGRSVGISGEVAVIGAPFDGVPGFEAGSVYIFKRISTDWSQQQRLTASDAEGNDFFGYSVAIDGNIVAVGAVGSDGANSDTGAVYIYDLSALPTPSITVTSPSTSTSFSSGDSLSIEWISTNTDPADSIILAMKRDSVTPSVPEPDGINWHRFTLDTPNDGIETVTIPAAVALADDWRFYARHADSGAFDGTDVNFSVVAPPEADLDVSLSAAPDPVQVGEDITYTVGVTNDGPDNATGVTLTDVLPADVSFVSVNQPSVCSENAGTVSCVIGNLPADTSFPDIEIVVTAIEAGTVINAVDLSGAEPDSDPLNNTAQVSITVNAVADLAISLSDSADPVVAGENLDYTITVANNGPSTAEDVTVTATLPSDVVLVATTGCVEDPTGVPACTLGSMAAGTQQQYTITVAVNSDAAGTLTNQAVVSSSTPEADPGDESGIEETAIATAADLSITKTDSIDPATAGTEMIYTITVSNAGPSDAQAVRVTDLLPEDVTFVSTVGCAEDPAGVPECSLGTVAAGDQQQYLITVVVDADASGTITNEASVASDTPESNPGDESTSEPTLLETSADLQLTMTDFPDPALVGEEISYALTVTNDGPSTATDVVLTHLLPGATTFTSATPAGLCTETGAIVTCNLGILDSGASAVVTIAVTTDVAGTSLHEASISSADNDPDNGNNTTSELTTVTLPQNFIFADGFESGDTTAWSATTGSSD